MKRFSVVLVLVIVVGACGGTPTTPTTTVAPTRPTAVLAGLVFEVAPSGLKVLEGARVRLEIGSFRLDAISDQNGQYTMAGLYDGVSSIVTTKDGYDTDTRKVTISGDMRLDIGVTLRVPHILSGVVSETTSAGPVPIEGAELYCDSCGPFGHTATHSDVNGFYSFSGVFNGSNPLIVTKDGYRDPPGLPPGPVSLGWREVTVKGDTRFDIQLVRR